MDFCYKADAFFKNLIHTIKTSSWYFSAKFTWTPAQTLYINKFPGLDNLSEFSSGRRKFFSCKTRPLLCCLLSLHKAPVCIREQPPHSCLHQHNNPHIIKPLDTDLRPYGAAWTSDRGWGCRSAQWELCEMKQKTRPIKTQLRAVPLDMCHPGLGRQTGSVLRFLLPVKTDPCISQFQSADWQQTARVCLLMHFVFRLLSSKLHLLALGEINTWVRGGRRYGHSLPSWLPGNPSENQTFNVFTQSLRSHIPQKNHVFLSLFPFVLDQEFNRPLTSPPVYCWRALIWA